MPKELKTSASDRRCMFPLCTHILSIYNHEAPMPYPSGSLPMGQRPKISPHHNGRLQIGPR